MHRAKGLLLADLSPSRRAAMETMRTWVKNVRFWPFLAGRDKLKRRNLAPPFDGHAHGQARHKNWMPPMHQIETGEWVEHEWWTLLDEKLQPVLNLARTLQTLGYY
jgi:hypothetical protein